MGIAARANGGDVFYLFLLTVASVMENTTKSAISRTLAMGSHVVSVELAKRTYIVHRPQYGKRRDAYVGHFFPGNLT